MLIANVSNRQSGFMHLDLGLSFNGLVWCGLVLFVAAFVRGYSGFGFSSVLIAGLTLVLPTAEIVPLSIALEVLASIGQARGVAAHVDRRKLLVLLAAGLIGSPIGVYCLSVVPDQPLRALTLMFIMAASIVLLVSRRRPVDVSLPVFVLAGLAAGIVNGATALSGLVLALFFAITGMAPAVMRATMIAYFFVTDLWTGGILVASGFFDEVTVFRTLAALPVLALGIWLGSNRFIKTPPGSFRNIVLSLLLLLCTIGLLRIALG